ncbi:MAG: hypothetical protein NC043_04745 [Muribaculaceae bacterium]|nr:hypothetical protein [Muribaculaceae bacterium]
MYRISLLIACILSCSIMAVADDFEDKYKSFKEKAKAEYLSFRKQCNDTYVQHLKDAWQWFDGKAPMPRPPELAPIPPKPYVKDEKLDPVVVAPVPVVPIPVLDPKPQPLPVEPVKEVPDDDDKRHEFLFYSSPVTVRIPVAVDITLPDVSAAAIARMWQALADNGMNNTIRDCLEARIAMNLCDWAYLKFLDSLCFTLCSDRNSATMLMAFLYCQSGYQMRLAVDGNSLLMLYGSDHLIYDKGYFTIDGTKFYPYGSHSMTVQICNAAFEGEAPMSLLIPSEQLLGGELSQARTIKSQNYSDVTVQSRTPLNLIEFFDSYPSSTLVGNVMTRWAMYANTPLAQKSRDAIYPALRKAIEGSSEAMAANKLLNWVQTGFVYEYDDKVWGHDRAFFAEETLYYPYCDCEDRSILFSRLIRDLLGLDVALVYYPGHLATAVCFTDDVSGSAIVIDGRKFVICDPTYIGAPVGAQMPGLEYDKTQAILLD